MLAVSTVFMNQSIFLELSRYFEVNIALARISFSTVSLSYSITFLLAGPLMNRGNLAKISFWGAAMLAITLITTSFAASFNGLLAGMTAIGFCAALIPAAMFPYISRLAPHPHRGFYVGTIVAAATLGVIFGRVLSGILTSVIGWQWSYRTLAVMVLITSTMTLLSLPSPQEPKEGKTLSLADDYKKSYQLLLRMRTLGLMLVGGTLFFSFMGIVTFLSYRLNNPPFNFSSREIGWISFAGITALVAPFSGKLANRVSIGKIILWGLSAALISCCMVGISSTLPGISLGLLILFLSVYLCQPLVFILVGDSVSPELLGSASSLYIFFCIGGGSLASMVLGPVWGAYGWHGVVSVCLLSLFTSLLLISLLKTGQQQPANRSDSI